MPKPYPRVFRDDVVWVARNRDAGAMLAEVAQGFGVYLMTLSKWLRQAAIERGDRPGVTVVESAELRAANKRIRSLEKENEVLCRAVAYLCQANPPNR